MPLLVCHLETFKQTGAKCSLQAAAVMENWLTFKVFEEPLGKQRSKPRILIAISKKIAPLAVTRNRVKRLVREVMRLEVLAEAGKAYWFRIRRVPERLNFEIVKRAILDEANG